MIGSPFLLDGDNAGLDFILIFNPYHALQIKLFFSICTAVCRF